MEISALGGDNTFATVSGNDVHKAEVCIDGMFAYTINHKPLKAGNVKTDACINNQRGLEARFCVKGFQESICTTASCPTAQLQSLRVSLSLIAYREWGFSVMTVPRASLK